MNQRFCIAALLTLAIAAYIPAFAQEAAWSDFIRDGEQAESQRDLKHAVELYQAALNEAESFDPRDPRLAESLYHLGFLYYQQDEYAKSEKWLKRAVECFDDTNDPNALTRTDHFQKSLHALEDVYKQANNKIAAAALQHRIDRIAPSEQANSKTRKDWQKGMELSEHNQFAEAQPLLKSAFEANRESDGFNKFTMDAYDALYIAYMGAKNYEQAEALSQKTLDGFNSAHGMQSKSAELMFDFEYAAYCQGRKAEASTIERSAQSTLNKCIPESDSKDRQQFITDLVNRRKYFDAVGVLKSQAEFADINDLTRLDADGIKVALRLFRRIADLSMRIEAYEDAAIYSKLVVTLQEKFFDANLAERNETYRNRIIADYNHYIDALKHVPNSNDLASAQERLNSLENLSQAARKKSDWVDAPSIAESSPANTSIPRMQSDVPADGPTQVAADSGPWLADLQNKIQRAWFPPRGDADKRVIVQFDVRKHGELSNVRLDRSSGLAALDQAALNAIQNAAPFTPLPPGMKDPAELKFTFDYNVFGGGHAVLRSF